MNVMKIVVALAATLSLSACMGGGQAVRELPGGTGTLAITSVATLEGDANLIQRFDASGREVASQLTTGESVAGDVVRATVPAVVNTVTGGIVAGALQGGGCGNNCGGGTVINVAGGSAQAIADSDSETNVDIDIQMNPLCPSVPATQQCPATAAAATAANDASAGF